MARGKIANFTENDAEPLWKIALYIRLSRDDGTDESLSVKNQKKVLQEFLSDFDEKYILCDYYIDDGQSGTDYERPAFQRLLHDIETKKVNCVICKNLARAFRNYADQGYFLEHFFPRHGTRFITLSDPKLDSYRNPEAISGMEVPISGLMNDRYAYATSSSVRKTFDTKRRRGEFIGAFAPYGYRKDPKDKNHLIIDEAAAQVVRDIFHWFVYGDGSSTGGMSKEGIARRLNERGIANPSLYKKQQGLRYHNPHAKENDGLWLGASVARLLKNKVYVGTMVQGRQRVISYKVHDMVNLPERDWFQVQGTHDAIISQALFEQAQALHAQDTRAVPGRHETYLFSGLLKCADCGKSMTRRTANGKVYYHCSTYKRKSHSQCTRHSIRLDLLEESVLDALQKLITDTVSIPHLQKCLSETAPKQTASTRLNALVQERQKELERIRERSAELYLDWKNGDLTREEYHHFKERFSTQEVQLCDVIGHLSEELHAALSSEDTPEPLNHFPFEDGRLIGLTQGLLVTLFERIEIQEGREIELFLRFQEPF